MAQPLSLTELIHRMQVSRDRNAADAVFAEAAVQLRTIARKMMSQEPPTGGFGASDLLQEAFLQKVAPYNQRFQVNNREHFFSIMARGMRQILIDRGRRRGAVKRVRPASSGGQVEGKVPEFVELRGLMQRLQELDPVGHRIVKLRTEEGATWDEISVQTGMMLSQCRCEYDHAIHWLRRRMRTD